MFRFILRRTVYKNFSKRQQKTLVTLLVKKHINNILLEVINFFLLASPLMISLFFSVSERKMNNRTRVILLFCVFGYVLFIGWFLFFFEEEMKEMSNHISSKLYFFNVTRKGKALSKADFAKIAVKKPQLLNMIENGKCRGFCYSVCFDLLKVLQEGYIKIIAVKNIESQDGKDYCLHVLYVNNGWAFDTYSHRQYPIKKILEIYQAKEFMDLYFEDIRSYSLQQFIYLKGDIIGRWCEKNDISQYLAYNSSN